MKIWSGTTITTAEIDPKHLLEIVLDDSTDDSVSEALIHKIGQDLI
jgi:hypothetical protein